jgi:hypothetical protein
MIDNFDIMMIKMLAHQPQITMEQACSIIEAYILIHKSVVVKVIPKSNELDKFEKAVTISCNYFQNI